MVMAVSFSMLIGVLWEFFEFGVDRIMEKDMQKDTWGSEVSMVSLEAGSDSRVTTISQIEKVTINDGEAVLNGYLDIGLYDTMEDLFVTFVGAASFNLFAAIYSIAPLPCMTNLLGWPAVYKNRRPESCAADTGELVKKKVEALMKSYGDKSRAVVKVDWFMRNRGHLFIAENQDDVIYFVDPQTGSLDAAWYFRYINPHSVIVMRTDQTNFTELVNLCFE